MEDRFAIEYLFQINVALGILYVGLSKFRFRENLYDSIVERINFHEYLEKPFDDVASGLVHNTGFHDKHKYIRSVVAILSEEYVARLKGDKNKLFPKDEKGNPPPTPDPPPEYCRFTEDRDKYWVGISNIIISLLALWILCFFRVPPPVEASFFGWVLIIVFGLLALTGQGIFGFYVYFGLRMGQKIKDELDNSLENATEQIGKVQAKLDEPPPFADPNDLPF